jgi:hypothetical protein
MPDTVTISLMDWRDLRAQIDYMTELARYLATTHDPRTDEDVAAVQAAYGDIRTITTRVEDANFRREWMEIVGVAI